ncbi:MAG: outer membrane beta-barrel protein, partial [Bacteroidetes bacterium]|nr:outer membrane beta-barrel protein [Bacteroidota bacterium]
MKKNNFTAILLLVAGACMAQTEKGRNMINGSINFGDEQSNQNYSNTNQVTKNNGYTLGLKYGRFVKDGVMAGIYGNYSNRVTKNDYTNFPGTVYESSEKRHSLENSFNAGLFTRYYKMLYKDKIALYGQVALGYGYLKSKNDNSSLSNGTFTTTNYDYNTNSVNLGIGAGITYFINKNLALETGFGYANYSYRVISDKQPNGTVVKRTSSNFNSDLGFTL